ncbi:hypothetical protein V6Z11_D02G136800 [Gossypium hirsutum]
MKLLCWNCRGLGNPAIVRELKQLIVDNNPDIVFLCEIKMHSNNFSYIRNICRIAGSLVVNSEGRSGGLAILWKDGVDVSIQKYFKHQMDLLVRMENHNNTRFTGSSDREDWVVGGYFNAIISDTEKEGGWRKPRVTMEDFKDVIEELSLVDIKTNKDWFTWVNNRDRNNMVKEMLDRFLISANAIDKFPFLATTVVRQTNSDHDAIRNFKDPRLFFKYEASWAKEKDSKDISKRAWNSNDTNINEKLEKVGVELGLWQHGRYKRMKNQIRELVIRIDKIIDGPHWDNSAKMLKATQLKLGHLYAKEWLKEGDRNIHFFHVRATSRLKKNKIDRLKDLNGTWTNDTNDICMVVWECFHSQFKLEASPHGELNLSYIQKNITLVINNMLARDFTDGEILEAFKQMGPRKAHVIDGLSLKRTGRWWVKRFLIFIMMC